MRDRVNELNQALTKSFTHAMVSIKPTDPRSGSYGSELRNWQQSFQFPKNIRDYFLELHNKIVLAGGVNLSTGPNDATVDFEIVLKKIIETEEYLSQLSEIKPKESLYVNEERLKIWNSEFYYPEKIKEFVKKLQKSISGNESISAEEYEKLLDELLDELESEYNSEKRLKKRDADIGGEKYEVDEKECKKQAEAEKEKIVKNVSNNPKYSEMKTPEKELFKKSIKKFKEDEIKIKAEKKILEKKYTEFQGTLKKSDNLDEALKFGAAKLKQYPKVMDAIAGAGIAGIVALMMLSITCLGCGENGFLQDVYEIEEKLDSTLNIREQTTLFDASGNLTSTEIIQVADDVIRNPYQEILESNVMYVLISTVIAPVSARILKEKFDIDIDEKQISMIMADGIKAVSMYTKEADKLRDKNGHIPRKYQKVLRNKAFKSIKENYDPKKYEDLIAKVGVHMFDKAIENGIISNKIGKFKVDKKLVEDIIRQSIDVYPGIIEWKEMDEEAKVAFINGNVRRALKNTGAEGWSYKMLEEKFDTETTKRILAAGLAAQKGLLVQVDPNNPYLKYTSGVVETVYATLGKSPES